MTAHNTNPKEHDEADERRLGLAPAIGAEQHFYHVEVEGGRTLEIGTTSEQVKKSFSRFMAQYGFGLRNIDEIKQLQVMALEEMTRHFLIMGMKECLKAVIDLQNELMEMDQMSATIVQNNRRYLGQTPPKAPNNRRPRMGYLSDLESCFTVSDRYDSRLVHECITTTMDAIRHELSWSEPWFGRVADIYCGNAREVLMKGDKQRGPILVAQLTRGLCIDATICQPRHPLTDPWEATHQSFLRAAQRPYAEGNFSQQSTSSPTAAAIGAIIQEHQHTFGLR